MRDESRDMTWSTGAIIMNSDGNRANPYRSVRPALRRQKRRQRPLHSPNRETADGTAVDRRSDPIPAHVAGTDLLLCQPRSRGECRPGASRRIRAQLITWSLAKSHHFPRGHRMAGRFY